MFKGFTNKQSFHAFNRNIGGSRQVDWNGYPVIFWLDASELVSYSLVSGVNRVDQWVDKASGIQHFPDIPANRATYNLTDANFNGFPSVTPANSGSLRAREQKGTTLQIGVGYTIVSVHSIPAIGGRNDLCCGSPNFSPNIGLAGTRVQWNGIGYAVGGDTVRLGTSYESTAPTIAVMTIDRFVINGSEQTITVGSVPAIQDFWGKMDWVGAGGTNAGAVIAELFCFPFQASLAEAQIISDLLNTKYAIY